MGALLGYERPTTGQSKHRLFGSDGFSLTRTHLSLNALKKLVRVVVFSCERASGRDRVRNIRDGWFADDGGGHVELSDIGVFTVALVGIHRKFFF